MGKIAFLFPGQGAQYQGMAQEFYEKEPASRQIFEQAEEVLKIPLTQLIFQEDRRLHETAYTQVAILTASLAILEKVKTIGIKADMTAGLSLGQYTSLVYGKVLTVTDAMQVVRQRGILMQEAVPLSVGCMMAVLGLSETETERICKESEEIVEIANYNCPGQLVISGKRGAVEQAAERLKAAGAKRVIPLQVSGPFHSSLLETAGEQLGQVLESVQMQAPQVPYVDNLDATLITGQMPVPQIKQRLQRQVYSSVRWMQSVEYMIQQGVTTFVEIGPGKTLTSFVKKIDRTCKTISIERWADLTKLEG